ncbi:RNA 2',3'-cyclic phosphodiesterase [Niveibacterium terrae]|uniref:RNA 2',3'-cyclic phosphodiesterase n=1 Tax=Niveibacterium terrae TaxID=3373598 RepID=UPI003A91B8F2
MGPSRFSFAMSAELARLFFACALPRGIGAALIERTAMFAGRGRPTCIEDLHLTLAFLGALPRERIDAAKRVGESLAGSPGFALRLDCLGAFARSSVIWASSVEPCAGLFMFQAGLVAALGGAGFAIDDTPFRPHVTLLRRAKLPGTFPMLAPLDWPVSGFALFESRPVVSGPRYSPLGEWRLGDDQTQRLEASSSHSSLGESRV